ncbi:MAG: hypothetical protein KZQ93_14690 [Candidatus Thiodiazotropha sp. (ex Monitilora ramsayi)]|nr:hypothetical protein [Candidatus Thiodiazotropha sp. (ex Monitilora ramsayi)]
MAYEIFSVFLGNRMVNKTHMFHAYSIGIEIAKDYETKKAVSDIISNDRFQYRLPGDTIKNSIIRSIQFEQNGSISMILDERSGVDNGVLSIVPVYENNRFRQWKCLTRDFPDIQETIDQCIYIGNLQP